MNHNEDIWSPSNDLTARSPRCPVRISHNEIRKSAWHQPYFPPETSSSTHLQPHLKPSSSAGAKVAEAHLPTSTFHSLGKSATAVLRKHLRGCCRWFGCITLPRRATRFAEKEDVCARANLLPAKNPGAPCSQTVREQGDRK